jgi:hypothetical protein
LGRRGPARGWRGGAASDNHEYATPRRRAADVPNVEVVGGAAVACDGTPGPRGRSTPEHDRVLDPPLPFVMGREKRRGSKRRRPAFHRLGTGCGRPGRDPLKRVGPTMEGTPGAADRVLLRGRARDAALSCEGPRQRAPGRADARASDSEVDSYREANQTPDDADHSGRRIITSLRQGVSEPIGLGRSFHRERSWWKELSERPQQSPNGL